MPALIDSERKKKVKYTFGTVALIDKSSTCSDNRHIYAGIHDRRKQMHSHTYTIKCFLRKENSWQTAKYTYQFNERRNCE